LAGSLEGSGGSALPPTRRHTDHASHKAWWQMEKQNCRAWLGARTSGDSAAGNLAGSQDRFSSISVIIGATIMYARHTISRILPISRDQGRLRHLFLHWQLSLLLAGSRDPLSNSFANHPSLANLPMLPSLGCEPPGCWQSSTLPKRTVC
jgi:hypothetical protein